MLGRQNFIIADRQVVLLAIRLRLQFHRASSYWFGEHFLYLWKERLRTKSLPSPPAFWFGYPSWLSFKLTCYSMNSSSIDPAVLVDNPGVITARVAHCVRVGFTLDYGTFGFCELLVLSSFALCSP